MKIKVMSDSLHQQVLGWTPVPRTTRDWQKIEDNLSPFSLQDSQDYNEVVELPIPEDFKDWKTEVEQAVSLYAQGTLDKIKAASAWNLPELPTTYEALPGWNGWNPKSQKWQPCSKFSGKTVFLDFETVEVSPGTWLPTCAVAMTDKGWMLWLTDFDNMVSVIPYGTDNTLINYNTQYDRAYLDSEYYIKDTGNRFFDIMSAWIVCRGLSNQQRPAYLAKTGEAWEPDWIEETATNGLSAVYEFYFGHPLDKGVRDQVVDQGLPWVQENMSQVVAYCIQDVRHTAELHSRLYPEYLLHRPSPVSQAGSILLGSCWLPLDAQRFPKYFETAETLYQQIALKTNEELMSEATKYLESSKDWTEMPEPAKALDWTEAKTGKNKGLPKWYRDVLRDYKKQDLTLGKRFVPIVLGITWKSEPLLWDIEDHTWYTQTYGWLPHPEVRGKNVTSVFCKGFVASFDQGILDTERNDAKELIADKMSCVNWISLRKRVKSIHTEAPEGFPVVLPQLLVNGTITGRCADGLWQVASNPKKSRIGTELKSMIAPPDGWVFVGADADQQEAWLSGIMGDSVLGLSASTPLGFICVAGAKAKTLADSTDLHSIMAKETGMTRDATKTRVYGKLYGQGIRGDENSLLKNVPGLTLEQARDNAKLFDIKFKGKKVGKGYKGGLASDSFSVMEAIADSKLPRCPLSKNVMPKSLAGFKDFKPSRVNWTIQSAGVDFRDMELLLTRYFFDRLGVTGKLLMSIHDEFRFMVLKGQEVLATYALQLAHLYTRAAFVDTLGLDCIPAGIAWHSAVDIDEYCLRKDPYDPQITPSQPQGIPKGRAVTPKELKETLDGLAHPGYHKDIENKGAKDVLQLS